MDKMLLQIFFQTSFPIQKSDSIIKTAALDSGTFLPEKTKAIT